MKYVYLIAWVVNHNDGTCTVSSEVERLSFKIDSEVIIKQLENDKRIQISLDRSIHMVSFSLITTE
jgi:hypothetical protein